MTNRLRFLLLDANVVIELFRQGLWDRILECCDVHLSRTVATTEAHFYEDDDGLRHDFDLGSYEMSGLVTVFDVSLDQDRQLTRCFAPAYLERFDPGERESLAHLVTSTWPYMICSADSIVFKVLGFLNRAEQGISLEEVLQQTGFGRQVAWQFSKAFRERNTQQGFRNGLAGSAGGDL